MADHSRWHPPFDLLKTAGFICSLLACVCQAIFSGHLTAADGRFIATRSSVKSTPCRLARKTQPYGSVGCLVENSIRMLLRIIANARKIPTKQKNCLTRYQVILQNMRAWNQYQRENHLEHSYKFAMTHRLSSKTGSRKRWISPCRLNTF